MSTYYLDSSGIVKRYVAESGSAWVRVTTESTSGNEVFTSLLSGAEVVAAICKRGRMGSLTPQDVTKALSSFKSEFRLNFTVIRVSHQMVEFAMSLAEKHGLRGYDSVQLATAVQLHFKRKSTDLPPLIFVSADDKLNAAAQAEGLAVENPNNHP